MFFYQNQSFLQYPQQILIYQPYRGPEQMTNLCPTILNQNILRSTHENNGLDLKVKAEDGEQMPKNVFSNTIDQKQYRKGFDSDYEPQQSRSASIYRNKNTETNLSNQIFSFLSSEKSKQLLSKLMGGDEMKMHVFYKLMKKIKKINRKYMSRTDIIDLVKVRQGTPSFKICKKFKYPFELNELQRVLRILVVYYLKNGCEITLLTSKKMNRSTLIQHLVKKRDFQQYFGRQLTIQN